MGGGHAAGHGTRDGQHLENHGQLRDLEADDIPSSTIETTLEEPHKKYLVWFHNQTELDYLPFPGEQWEIGRHLHILYVLIKVELNEIVARTHP